MSLRTRLGIEIDADTSGVDRGVGQATGSLGRFGGGVAKVARGAAIGLGAIGAAAGFVGKEVADSASRQQQAMGAVETVFGRAADKVKKWADNSAASVGLAESEYAELATVVGSQLQNMGLSQDKAAGKTKDLIKIGADMAATYGGSVSDAVSAVSSLMRGEADPIERYGVGIKKSDINARLAAQGLDGLTGSALKQAEAQATLSLLNEQTAKTSGAFARESDTLAGAQARLGAKVENLKAQAGEKLLPVLTNLTNLASERLLPGAIRLGEAFGEKVGPAMSKVGEFIRERVVPAGRNLAEWYGDRIAPILATLGRVIIPAVSSAFGAVADKVRENRPQLEKLRDVFVKLMEFFTDKVIPFLGPILGKAIEGLGATVGLLIDGVGLLVDGFEKLVEWGTKVKDALSKIKMPNIDFPDIPGLRLPGGLSGRTSAPPGAAAPTVVDARTYITVAVTPPAGVPADPNAWAAAMVAAIRDYFARLALPDPFTTSAAL